MTAGRSRLAGLCRAVLPPRAPCAPVLAAAPRAPVLAAALCALVLVLAAAPMAPAQEAGRALEMPGHRALMALLDRDGRAAAPFETDGCSGGMSGAWKLVAGQFPAFAEAHRHAPPWEGCCVTHDRAYHDAGDARSADDSFDARLEADTALRTCVAATASTRRADLARLYDMTETQVAQAYDTIAAAMYLAVRFGGGPCSGLPWRWGFGFDHCTPLDGAFKSR